MQNTVASDYISHFDKKQHSFDSQELRIVRMF